MGDLLKLEGINITLKDGKRLTAKEYLHLHEGIPSENLMIEAVKESKKYGKSIIKHRRPSRPATELRGVLQTKVFSIREIREEESKMANHGTAAKQSFRRDLLLFFMKHPREWFSLEDLAHAIGMKNPRSLSSYLTKFMRFFGDQKGLLDKKNLVGTRNYVFSWKAESENPKQETDILYLKFLEDQNRQRKSIKRSGGKLSSELEGAVKASTRERLPSAILESPEFTVLLKQTIGQIIQEIRPSVTNSGIDINIKVGGYVDILFGFAKDVR